MLKNEESSDMDLLILSCDYDGRLCAHIDGARLSPNSN